MGACVVSERVPRHRRRGLLARHRRVGSQHTAAATPGPLMTTAPRALFVDRDGVINEVTAVAGGSPRSPRSVDELDIVPDAAAALRRAHDAGYVVVVVTNQPDIARGTTTARAGPRDPRADGRGAPHRRLLLLSARHRRRMRLPQAGTGNARRRLRASTRSTSGTAGSSVTGGSTSQPPGLRAFVRCSWSDRGRGSRRAAVRHRSGWRPTPEQRISAARSRRCSPRLRTRSPRRRRRGGTSSRYRARTRRGRARAARASRRGLESA